MPGSPCALFAGHFNFVSLIAVKGAVNSASLNAIYAAQCWGLLLKKVIYYILDISLKNSHALHYMITP